MVTKYVCLVSGCNFVTEDKGEAIEHGQKHHPGVKNVGAKVILENDDDLDCELL